MGARFDEKRFHHVLLTAPIETNAYLYEQVKTGLQMDVPERFAQTQAAN